jgi:GNAT superfamily N-acetyltransferase
MKGSPQDPSGSPQLTAIEENLFAFFASMKGWPKLEVHDEPDHLWTICDVPFPLLNSVLRANLAPERVDDAIQAAIERCRSRHVPMLWWTGPASRPADLGVHLAAKGFRGRELPGMAVLLSAQPPIPPWPTGLVVEQVTDLDTLTQYCKAFCKGFEMPDFLRDTFFDLFRCLGLAPDLPLRHYIGWFEGEPVATSCLFLGAGVGGVYNVATVLQARRRGLGTAMTSTALLQARAEGCQVAILHASEMGAGVYRSLGFEEYCKIETFLWTG